MASLFSNDEITGARPKPAVPPPAATAPSAPLLEAFPAAGTPTDSENKGDDNTESAAAKSNAGRFGRNLFSRGSGPAANTDPNSQSDVSTSKSLFGRSGSTAAEGGGGGLFSKRTSGTDGGGGGGFMSNMRDKIGGNKDDADTSPTNTGDAVPRVLVPAFEPGSPCGDVSVKDPQKGGTIQKYITYLVAGNIGGEPFSSRKRYSEFEWFRGALALHFPGVLLPMLPLKKGLGRFEESFVEERRIKLEEFMRRLLQRPGFAAKSSLVRRFLATADGGIEALKKEFDERSMFDMYTEYKTALQPIVAPPASPCDLQALVACLDQQAVGQREAVDLLSKAAIAQRSAVTAQSVVAKKLGKLSATEAKASAAVRPSEGSGSGFLSRFEAHAAATTESPMAHLELLISAADRELADCEAMAEAIRGLDVLQKRLQDVRKRVEKNAVEQSRLAQQTGAAVEASSTSASPPSKRDMFMNRMSGVSAKLKISKAPDVEEREKVFERDNQDASIGDEWLLAARAACSGPEAAGYFVVKAGVQQWCQREFRKQSAADAQKLVATWSKTR